MFRKSDESFQGNLFTFGDSLFSGKSRKLYQDENAWHNQFRQQVTMQIDESQFEPLYISGKGSPNASIRVMVAMMILKEAEGISDQKLFEDCRFNLLTQSAIGLLNASDPVPTESTYYLFRKMVLEHAKKEGNENLFDTVFSSITQKQCLEFNVSGRRIRMDSKLLGSNLAWLSRYELVHETLRLFYREEENKGKLDKATKERLDDLLKIKGNKIVYVSTSSEVKTKLQELGGLIGRLLPLFSYSENTHYSTLVRVFDEQFKLDEDKVVVRREKEEISAKSIQSPHDTDCHFRNKDGNKVKGYSLNLTESCDDENELNLIGDVDVREASTSDVDFFQDGVQNTEEVFTDKAEDIHADGAYHSTDNQEFCSNNNANLHLHAIQGAKSRFQLELQEEDQLTVLDTQTNELIEAISVKGKNQEEKWRINTEKGYRYFTQKEIDTSALRKKIKQTPQEILQKRNNVEATIFQLGYHYSNAKSRYRGLIKHQMWADMRCLWINFVRILNFKKKSQEKSVFSEENSCLSIFEELFFAFLAFLLKIKAGNFLFIKNLKFTSA